ncbi:MAG: hypothetical protein CMF62_02380 [Magnetococcales bacterium]|nr:hypothetical protein [Magnetococcales bacterium]|tara:strand:+ start:21692 stop:22726 length:1035 start_codon:yes stop_codon:yes gene_type:complete
MASTEYLLEFGSFLGEETLEVEFKEFSLRKHRLIFTKDEVYSFIKNQDYSHICKFSRDVLITYFENYIPKYFSAFLNNSKLQKGELWFGISDSGEVLGLPATMTYEEISTNVIDQIKKVLFLNGNLDILDTVLKELKIEIFDVINSSDDQLDMYLTKFKSETKKYQIVFSSYRSEYKKVNKMISYYRRAINTMINEDETRKALIKMVISSEFCPEIKEKVMKKLVSSDDIIFEIGEVTEQKSDPRSPAYWIAKYRDIMIKKYKRPERPIINKPHDPYFRIIQDMNIMGPQFIKAGNNLVVIKITFPTGLSIKLEERLHFQGAMGNLKIPERSFDCWGKPCTKWH